MSRAFVKEGDENESGDDLPERRVSTHRNLVTSRGLEQIDDALRRLREALTAARAAGDRSALAVHERDLRYWSQRRAAAELIPAPTEHDIVRFGARVLLGGPDGAPQAFRIVGEDEADPAHGCISYVAPLGEALLGSRIGDRVEFGGQEFEILGIE